jgi:hypothetical protein
MRAMQIIEWGKPLEAREYPDPVPKGEEVLLRVEAAGVCHSDVHIWDGHFDLGGGQQISLESRGVHLPFTMGHEIAGEVAALGPHASATPAPPSPARLSAPESIAPCDIIVLPFATQSSTNPEHQSTMVRSKRKLPFAFRECGRLPVGDSYPPVSGSRAQKTLQG